MKYIILKNQKTGNTVKRDLGSIIKITHRNDSNNESIIILVFEDYSHLYIR